MKTCSSLIVRPERPTLRLEDASVVLHFTEASDPEVLLSEPCGYFTSFELDLLSYQFQLSPPIQTHAVVSSPIPVRITTGDVTYRSEGREMLLKSDSRPLLAQVLVSRTYFKDSGIRIWHLVFHPADGSYFTEFDIIRFIHLYDGRTEQTDLKETMRFSSPEIDSGRDKTVCELASGIIEEKLACPMADSFALRAGTVQIVTGGTADCSTGENQTINQLLASVAGCREKDDEFHRELISWFGAGNNSSSQNQNALTLMALCGIVTGIFDFDCMGDEEVLDTLEPTFGDKHNFMKISRATLICISTEDRILDECENSIGVNPYHTILHSVIIHNEELVAQADSAADSVLRNGKADVIDMDNARRLVHENLGRLYIPNIFNYPTERVMYTEAETLRGLKDRYASTRRKLDELENNLNAKWQKRRDQSEKWITILLAVISMLQIKDPVFSLFDGDYSRAYIVKLVVFVVLCVLAILLISRSWSHRSGHNIKS